ncbi:MAG TPA: hypothetical protein ENI23_06765 [bacterium]|nr:hypothetical protein [bacterium]
MAFEPVIIPTPGIPASLLIVGDEPDVLKALKYRTQVGQYGASFLNVIAQYMTSFSTNLDELVMPVSAGDEEAALNELFDKGNFLSSQLQPLTEALITAMENELAGNTVDFDVQGLVDTIMTRILAELNTGDESVEMFRTLLKGIIDSALLNSSYGILSSESILITDSVDSFISRSKSVLDEQMVELERQSMNQLDIDGVLDSDIGSEVLARVLAKKGRQYKEIEFQAEEIRMKWSNDAFDRAIQRERTKIQAGSLLPVELLKIPSEFYRLMGDLVNKRFLDRNQFINTYPSMLTSCVASLESVARLRQGDRHVSANYSLEVGKTIIELFGLMSGNLQSIATSIAKMGTFEAS